MANVVLHKNKEARVYSGHPWVFRSDIDRVDGTVTDGGVVRVLSSRGKFLAMAVYNPRSQISLRILSRQDEPIDAAFIRARVKRAVDYRRLFADLHSCRLIFAESDGLPAVIADSFGDVIVLQVLCLGMEAFKQDIVSALVDELHPSGIYERNDVPVRELEGLSQQTGLLYGAVPDRVEMAENGVRFWVDVKEGQKTGFFLDQKENRAAIAPFVKDMRVLDCFTHTGSFALHAGCYGAREVTGVDISDYACECAAENARLNGLESRVRFECANAFDYLRAAQDRGERYDVVILDPPAFTKTRSAVEGALRGYKEINLRGMKLVRDGGFLVTCSCSQHVTPPLFQNMLLDAQKDARVQLRQIEWRTQGRDHPILPSSPETQYLKCGVYQVFK
ncbi:MAG: class I SAM-dependent rRNA methyltransferase [Clostridiales bacterium]|nr:class I SAM-dependent rRNA methyltransferase [Clostridiales bacterium]MDO4350274.1 class I SAM-dependent rRNA methyltransferase [Eubacteriales bacterium]MDY4007614.1 class I SAM-dependent rRNA methyltransferase [Candidatus Limiplasma sp.]